MSSPRLALICTYSSDAISERLQTPHIAQRALLALCPEDVSTGADPKVVQRVLGHATAAMTMDLYGHMVDANLWQAARLVGGITGASELPEWRIQDDGEAGMGSETL